MFVIYPSITEACSLTAWHAHVPSTSDYKSIRNELYEPVLDKMTSYCLTYLLSLSKKSLCITSLNDLLQMSNFFEFLIWQSMHCSALTYMVELLHMGQIQHKNHSRILDAQPKIVDVEKISVLGTRRSVAGTTNSFVTCWLREAIQKNICFCLVFTMAFAFRQAMVLVPPE